MLNLIKWTHFSLWFLLQQTAHLSDKKKSLREEVGLLSHHENTHRVSEWPHVARGRWLPWEQECWAADSHTETDVRGKDRGNREETAEWDEGCDMSKGRHCEEKSWREAKVTSDITRQQHLQRHNTRRGKWLVSRVFMQSKGLKLLVSPWRRRPGRSAWWTCSWTSGRAGWCPCGGCLGSSPGSLEERRRGRETE